MIKKKSEKGGKLEIDLTGPDGNAFVLLGYAQSLSKQLGLDYKQIRGEMTSGDYKNLVNVFDRHFGEFVIMYN